VVQIRIIQRTESRFDVLVLPGPGFGPDTPRAIEALITESLAPSKVEVRVQLVDDFPRGGAGKHRTIVSEVPPR
jgi:hypothetical protein